VLDLTRFLAGPYCTMCLADYGADVVKLEAREGRELPRSPSRESYFFLSANRGKRSITLDLRKPGGKALLLDLLPHFDVLVENFRPDVMERLGLSAELLLERFPRLVYCGISGFGPDGPYRDRPGLDQIAQGMSGFMSLTGTEDSGPTRAGIAIADVVAGMFAAQGIQLALLARERTGRGQVVHTSLFESMIGVLSWGAGRYFETGSAPGPAGQHHPLSSPYGRFRARDGYLNLAAPSDRIWKRLVEALDRPAWLEDARFATPIARLKEREALTRELEDVLGQGDVAHWVEHLNAAGVPTGPVLDVEQLFADPQVAAREMLLELPHPEVGTFRTTGLPIKLSETPGAVRRAPPLHGEHTDVVLGECGFDASAIARLRQEEVI
jgi:crotonobetainyl-CoA:carnitine CoA-transferase CaiB-like acyl-CoA transferase